MDVLKRHDKQGRRVAEAPQSLTSRRGSGEAIPVSRRPWQPPTLPAEFTDSRSYAVTHWECHYRTPLTQRTGVPARTHSYGYSDQLTSIISDEIENKFSFFTFLSLFFRFK
jgi:hypothetical protein